ncbi:MAG TPA: GyrI-like domain-containing protein [Thermoanaerobacterales bacterium]|mgnify:CR=1 FL=1|jgi:effector-binding domain-containing protein|nr:GyrI-like domain-containing protein [Thermoanaerobacterales bacterium]
MDYKIELTEESEQPVLSMRTVTSVSNLPQVLGHAYHAIINYLQQKGLQPSGPAFTAYYNMDMENLDVEMGFPVAKKIPGQGEIKSSVIPEGKQVSCLYKGSYQECGPVYEAMTKWMQEKGYTPTGVAYEFYYNSPEEVPESELLTKVVFPLT